MGVDYFFAVVKAKDLFKIKYLLRLKSISFEDLDRQNYNPPRDIAGARVYGPISNALYKHKAISRIKLPEDTTLISLKNLSFNEIYNLVKEDKNRWCETELEAAKHLLTWLKRKYKEGYDALLITVSY